MRFRLIGLLIMFCSSSFGQTVLEGSIKNLKEGKIYLWNTDTNQLDSINVKNHKFRFKVNLKDPTFFNLKIKGYNDWNSAVGILLSKDVTTLTFEVLKVIENDEPFKNVYSSDPILKTDPNVNRLLFEFKTSWQDFSKTIMNLTPNSDESDSLLLSRKSLYENFIQDLEQFVSANSDKEITAVILLEYIIKNGLTDIAKAKELFLQLHEDIRYSSVGVKIGTHINKVLSIETGQTAPQFEFIDISGNKNDISDFKGKSILLHFWSSTCGPCRVGNKNIVELKKENKDLIIVNISLDTNKKQWENAISKDGLMGMINTSELKGMNSQILEDYHVSGIPTHFLINEEGRIISKGTLEEIKVDLSN